MCIHVGYRIITTEISGGLSFSIVVDKGMLNVPLRPPLRNIYEVQNSFPFAILWHPLEIASFVNS